MAQKSRVIRVVLDTNIFLRALIRRGNIPDQVIDLWKNDKLILITSRDIINELDEVLKRPFLIKKYGYSPKQVDKLIGLLTEKAIFVEPHFSMQLCRDKNDDKFVDCAILGRVNYLISEDNDFLKDEQLKKQLAEFSVVVMNSLQFYQLVQ